MIDWEEGVGCFTPGVYVMYHSGYTCSVLTVYNARGGIYSGVSRGGFLVARKPPPQTMIF